MVMNQASLTTGNDRFRELRSIANELHINYYERKRHLNAEIIGRDIESIAELLELLSPLTSMDS